jgi:hypothetical protein
MGGLMGAGGPEDDAHAYVEGVRRGGTLLTVNASDVEADDVREIMLRNGAVDMTRRMGEWRDSGWDSAVERNTPAYEPAAGEPMGGYRSENLGDVDRKVVDPAYTDVDRTGERVKGSGYASGHDQPVEREPQAFGEFLADDERNFRSPVDTRTGAASATDTSAYRDESYNTIAPGDATEPRADMASESGMRSERYAGADEMGGALSNMRTGSGSEQPGRDADQPGASSVRIYGDSRREEDTDTPAHGDYARGMRDQPADPVEPDYARGTSEKENESLPAHGDYARGMRDETASPVAPDYARGQRSFEHYDNDFLAHYRSMTGAGGQPYDYYKPGYQFGYDLANDQGFSHEGWESGERDARQRWERDARGSWDEFKDTIRYGWEKARGLR